MGLIYQNALVTLISSGGTQKVEVTDRLLHRFLSDEIRPRQAVETIRGREYITSMMPFSWHLMGSHWNYRGWTYQEGALSRRIAFFGGLDVSFQCGAGHWRESLHSGPYGHDANLSDGWEHLDLRTHTRWTLSIHRWLDNSNWCFSDYQGMISMYTIRELSYESDKINAISGCLNMLGLRKGIQFVWGLPSIDFHYALLWTREYDRPRIDTHQETVLLVDFQITAVES